MFTKGKLKAKRGTRRWGVSEWVNSTPHNTFKQRSSLNYVFIDVLEQVVQIYATSNVYTYEHTRTSGEGGGGGGGDKRRNGGGGGVLINNSN